MTNFSMAAFHAAKGIDLLSLQESDIAALTDAIEDEYAKLTAKSVGT